MMKISDLLSEDVVKVGLAADEKEEVIEEMIDFLERCGRVQDRDAARDAIMQREAKQSTGIGRGVAIPHGKSACIKQLTAALGISKHGVEFDSLDGEPVQVVFMLLAEANNPGPHIQALAQIARLFQLPHFIEDLIAAETPRQVMDAIVAGENREE
jgi:PTS system fructose-specific IIC component